MLSRHRFCCYMCLPNALLLRECGLHILTTILIITLAYINYFYLKCICFHSVVDILLDFESMYPGFESRESHEFFYFLFIFFFRVFLSLLLQCKFANSTLLSLLRFSYFITPCDAQASSPFSALITTASPLTFKSCLF